MNLTMFCTRRRTRVATYLSGVAGVVAFFSSACALAAMPDVTDLSDFALEDLLHVNVASASRFSQSVSEAPATVTVIGEEELRQRGYRNLAEALVTVPGVYSSNDRGYTSLGVRGFNRPGDYGTRVLLLTDGSRRNDPLYDQALFGHEAPIEMDWVKRLEFVSGPASAVYGSNALFGTVNAIMLDGRDINGARVTLDTGSNDSKRLGLVAGQRLDGDREWFLGFAAYKSQGNDLYFSEFDDGVTDGHARGLDGEAYEKAYAKLRWGNWRLSGNFSARKKDIPTAWYETSFGQSGTSARDESRLIELRYDGDNVDGWQPSLRVFSGHYRFDARYQYDLPPNTKDYASANWYGSEFHLAYTRIPDHKLVFGVDNQWNTVVQQQYFEIDPRNQILDTNNPSRVVSLFVEDEWRFHPEWLLNLGLRHDKNSDFAAVTSPRAALIWQPISRFSLKAMAGSAYRTPNAYERFYSDDSATQTTNPGLQPEHITSSELAASYRFGQNGRVGISLYKNQMRDLIDQTTDAGLTRYINQSHVNARGIEIDAENQWSGGYRLRGSVTAQQSRLADGTALVNSPRLMGKLVFAMPVAAGWSVAGEVLGTAAQRGDNGSVPGYAIANLSVLSTPVAGLGQFRLQIVNLGDRRYSDPTSSYLQQRAIEQDGRQIRLSWILSL